MTTLSKLRRDAELAEAAFVAACAIHFCDGQWGYYRAIECNRDVPGKLHELCDKYHAALHDYYRKRDGDKGFLGSRGL